MACRLFRKSRLLTRPPRRAKTRRSAGKAATPWLTLVSRFTFHASRFTIPGSDATCLREALRRRQGTPLADFFSILLGYFRNVAGINVQNLADGQPTDRRFDGVAGDEKVRSI